MRLLALAGVLALGACGGGGGDAIDAAVDDGGGSDAFVIGDTPAGTWTWVEIPGTMCANGTPAGIGVNRSTQSGDLFVLFQGGGACWDGPTCFTQRTSSHIEDTYTMATLTMELGTAARATPSTR